MKRDLKKEILNFLYITDLINIMPINKDIFKIIKEDKNIKQLNKPENIIKYYNIIHHRKNNIKKLKKKFKFSDLQLEDLIIYIILRKIKELDINKIKIKGSKK